MKNSAICSEMPIQNQQAKRLLGVYYLTLLICCVPGIILFAMKGYNESFLWLNSFHHPILDALMPHLTHIGEGAFLTAIFALLMRKTQPAVVVSLAVSMLLVLAIIGPLKHQTFEMWARPLAYFKKETFHYVALRDWYAYAFPSGHSAAAASMLAYFALVSQKEKWAVLIGLIAVFAAYTRVYIGVHFLGDILVGLGVGMLISATVFVLIYARLRSYFENLSKDSFRKWQIFFQLAAALTIVISLYELIRTYYI